MFSEQGSFEATSALETTEDVAADGDQTGGSNESILSEANRIERLMAEAAKGDLEAAEAICGFFDDPDAAWQEIGDLTAHLKRTLAVKLLGSSEVKLHSLLRRMEFDIEQLVGADPSPLEKLAAERLVLASQAAAAQEMMALTADAFGEPSTVKMLEAAERRIQFAMKTFQAAQAMSRRGTPQANASSATTSGKPDVAGR